MRLTRSSQSPLDDRSARRGRESRNTRLGAGRGMKAGVVCGVTLLLGVVGCSREPWPEPPAVDQSQYEAEYRLWRNDRQLTAAQAVRLIGMWALHDGETQFGSDASLPIVLPTADSPARAGLFRRQAEKITVVPAPGVSLRWEGGGPITGPSDVHDVVALGSLRLQVEEVGEGFSGRRFVTAWDDDHPAARNLPEVQTYSIDPGWRVAARFEAFEAPTPITVADVRGGVQHFMAAGQLVFRANDQEWRLTAFTVPDADEFFVMFRDSTNGSTTYSGYRMLYAPAVAAGTWTVLDFNLAANPPCAYSPYTLCPLPPPENRLQVAVEAGEKRLPGVERFIP